MRLKKPANSPSIRRISEAFVRIFNKKETLFRSIPLSLKIRINATTAGKLSTFLHSLLLPSSLCSPHHPQTSKQFGTTHFRSEAMPVI